MKIRAVSVGHVIFNLCTGLMEKGFEGNRHWYDLVNRQYRQDLVAKEGNERRVYVVALQPELENAQIPSCSLELFNQMNEAIRLTD